MNRWFLLSALMSAAIARAGEDDPLGRAIGAWSRSLAQVTAAIGADSGPDAAGLPGGRASFEDGRQQIAAAVAEIDALHFGPGFRATASARQRLSPAMETALSGDTASAALTDACRARVQAVLALQGALEIQTRNRTLSAEQYQAWQMGIAYADEAKGMLQKKQVVKACRKAHLAETQWLAVIPEVYPPAREETLLPTPGSQR